MWVGGNSDTFSEQKFRGRVRLMSIFFAIGFSVITVRLFYLQVIRGGDLANVSESNRTQLIFLRAPRGDFYDRKGRVMVMNRPSWSLIYSVPEKNLLDYETMEKRLRPFLETFPNYWSKRLQGAFQTKQMVRLVDDIPDRVAFLMKEMEETFPGLRVMMEFRRGYPIGVMASHLVGYLGEVSDKELKNRVNTRKSGELVGKMGLEKIQDDLLRGEDGGMLIEVDSVGRLKRVIKELPSKKGHSVTLTLDLDAQKVAEEELAKTETKRGAAVAMDVNTGAVLVWASSPGFDPTSSLADTLKDPRHPFLDRVYRGTYPPGSTFKIITAIAGFEKGVIRTQDKVMCVGFVTLPDSNQKEKKYRCWKTHGEVNYWRAMAESCDTYFYLLGKKVGSQAISETAQAFGLGQSIQETLAGENKGTIPNPFWKKKSGLGGWSTGDTYNMAIGQGFVTATPLQIAGMMAILATKGQLFRPYMIEKISNLDGQEEKSTQPFIKKTVVLKDSTWDSITRSLENVVTQGTGQASFVSYLDIHGKTGTAQNPHGEDHAWFAGYAGYKDEKPSVAVCVFVENGGHGGAIAAPIVKRILESLFPLKPETVKSS